ncbi:MAG TPA: molybdopterin-dependent oxidoreductase [Burkholderiaceae bacterium]|nr:molybdopterin-dependent oxidoreductase [Burkholderiaceae bacterium]
MNDSTDSRLLRPELRPDLPATDTATTLIVNGHDVQVHGAPARRLSDCLRDELGLTGTKIGCHAGDCGACTVLLDGEQVCACLVAVGQCGGRSVVTVEGLADADGTLSRLQRAFLEHGAAQCGICTPGMLMAAADTLRRTPRPTEQQVCDGLGGVLCRCTGYRKIVEAVLAAAGTDAPDRVSCDRRLGAVPAANRPAAGQAVGDFVPVEQMPGAVAVDPSVVKTSCPAAADLAPAAGQAVGARLVRLDGLGKVDGSERYGADRAPADALWLRVIRSPHASATFRFGDLDGFVARHPGLAGVVLPEDIPFNRFAIFPDLRDQPAIAEGRARLLGEAVLVLAGDATTLAAIDETALPIEWQPLPALEGPDAALADGAPALHERWPDNVLCRGRVVRGDVDAAIPGAAVRLGATMTTSHVEHAYIEPEAGYAIWHGEDAAHAGRIVAAADRTGAGEAPGRRGDIEEPGGPRGAPPGVTVFATTQTPYMDRDELASMFGLMPTQVRIIPSAVGGGFGGKLDLSIQPLLVAAARKFGRPARIVYSRPESMVSTTKRHPSRLTATLAADRDGRLLAYDFAGDFDTGAYSSWGPTVANRVPIHASGPYRVANVRALTRAVYTNNPIAGAFRGFGVPQSTLINEWLIDELAARLALDPLELRFEQALRAGDRTPCGQLLAASVGLRECLAALRPAWRRAVDEAHRFNVEAERAGVAEGTSDPHTRYPRSAKRRGAGVACMWYGIGNTVIANPSAMTLGLTRDGRFVLYNGAVDIGQGTYTVMPQIAADALGVPVAAIEQVVSDTALTLDAGKSSASRQTFVSGNAAKGAGDDLRRRLLALLELPADGTVAVEGIELVGRAGDRQVRRPLAGLPAVDDRHISIGRGDFDPPTVPLDADGQGVPYATYGFAAQFAEVEVDVELGTVRVLAIHAAHDVGRAINPTLVEGQIHGGIAQGLGLALMEDYRAGRTDNLHDYLIPTVGDIPPITVHLIEDPEPLGPYGAKGVGEPALVATAPAILNAIHAATGVRVAHVPATPDRLRAAIRAAGSRHGATHA